MSVFKYVIVTRHGELVNPNRRVYNRDSQVSLTEVMHVSPEGRQQMRDIAQEVKYRGLNIKKILSSPQIRTLECAYVLMGALEIDDIGIDDDLEDNWAPGPCREKMTIAQYEELGSVYDLTRWPDHETPKEIIARMKRGFYKLAGQLKLGEAGILLSHGDPIGWLVNYLRGVIPDPSDLRQSNYPPKGSALIFTLSHLDEILNVEHLFTPNESQIY